MTSTELVRELIRDEEFSMVESSRAPIVIDKAIGKRKKIKIFALLGFKNSFQLIKS